MIDLRWSRVIVALATAGLASAAPAALAAKPDPTEFAQQLDASLAKEVLVAGVDVAPRCDDATFLRRAWIDIAGDIPAPERVIAFALDAAPDKRARVVRELLADEHYGLNWARYWRDVIFSRRIEDRATDILALWEARKDISLEELRAGLAGIGLIVSVAGLHRFFVRRGMTRKKRLAMQSSKTGQTS